MSIESGTLIVFSNSIESDTPVASVVYIVFSVSVLSKVKFLSKGFDSSKESLFLFLFLLKVDVFIIHSFLILFCILSIIICGKLISN